MNEEPDSEHKSFRLTGEAPSVGSLREAFVVAVVHQIVLLPLAALLLDGGAVLRRVVVASVAFWCFVLALLIRRRDRPTTWDVVFVKYGIWPLLAVTIVVAKIFGRY